MFVATAVVLLFATAAFLLELDATLSLTSITLSLAILTALYAGWERGGAVPGAGAVALVVYWWFVVPPLIGYWRWSWDTRYTPPRFLGYKLDPRGEVLEGLTHGIPAALVGALVLGGTTFLLGVALRRAVVARRT